MTTLKTQIGGNLLGANGNSGMANIDIALLVKSAGSGPSTLTDRWASTSTYPTVDPPIEQKDRAEAR